MKFILSALILLSASTAFTQSTKMIVSARNDSITVSGDDNNDDKTFVLQTIATSNAMDYLTVNVLNENIRSTWRRSFYIYDMNDQIITYLKPMQKDEYCIKMSELLSKLEKNKTYKLISIIIPQDQTKAMAVKIPPLLVCNLKLGN